MSMTESEVMGEIRADPLLDTRPTDTKPTDTRPTDTKPTGHKVDRHEADRTRGRQDTRPMGHEAKLRYWAKYFISYIIGTSVNTHFIGTLFICENKNRQ